MSRADAPPAAMSLDDREQSVSTNISTSDSCGAASTALHIIISAILTVLWKYTEVYISERATISPSTATRPLLWTTRSPWCTMIVWNSRAVSMVPCATPV